MSAASNEPLPRLPQWQRAAPDLLSEYMRVEPPIYAHFGVYGVCLDDSERRVLVIRKARGPYTGLFDLPGGTPEPHETHEETLAREIAEETGGEIVVAESRWHPFALCVAVASDSTRVAYDHRGVFKRVRLSRIAATGECAVQHDVAGLEWIDLAGWHKRGDLSSALQAALHTVSTLSPWPSSQPSP